MNNSTEKKLTIDEVAKLCGVSKTSISRYLNGKTENLSESTRERIAKVIEETHYRPNKLAQRLKASKSKLVGCVIGDISSPFSALLLRGITAVCDEADYQILIADCGEDGTKEKTAIEGLLQNGIDGLIINTTGKNDDFLISLQNRNIPIVLADRGLMQDHVIDTVTTANRKNARECVKLLKDYGYEKIAFMSEGNGLISPRIKRCEGYLDGLREYYYDDSTPYVCEFNRHIEDDCRNKIQIFLDKYPDQRTAFLAVNGVTCQNILFAANEMNILFGYDIGLCSFDDWAWNRLAPPGITSVKNHTEAVGAEAARILLEKINGNGDEEEPVNIEIPSEIIIRGSTRKEPILFK